MSWLPEERLRHGHLRTRLAWRYHRAPTQARGISKCRGYHERGCTSILEARCVFGQDAVSSQVSEADQRWYDDVAVYRLDS